MKINKGKLKVYANYKWLSSKMQKTKFVIYVINTYNRPAFSHYSFNTPNMENSLFFYNLVDSIYQSAIFQEISQGFIIFIISFWIALLIWMARDIVHRTDSLFYQVFCILLGLLFIPGWILYLMLRPPRTLSQRYDEELERQAFLDSLQREHGQCPSCSQEVGETFQYCPHCQAQLKNECKKCHKLMNLDWTLCPFCGDTPQKKHDHDQAKKLSESSSEK
ncbi:MAG: zinc ribbon domain-containing protein [Patescibacteria group bacterium]|nr:zinc ribbon domain-containing protein [Patescibacteria group bacterium]